jgi:uncharacterized membrane protein (DUF485 family)
MAILHKKCSIFHLISIVFFTFYIILIDIIGDAIPLMEFKYPAGNPNMLPFDGWYDLTK